MTRGFLLDAFPGICAWRLSDYFSNTSVSFHLDSFTSHVCEAFEIFEKAKFHTFIYPRGDCANPVISTADLLLEVLDKRLLKSKSFLQFDEIRPHLPEFREKVLVYPIHSKHLHYITPLDKKLWENTIYIKHPVFWLFKGDPIIASEVLKNSQAFRDLVNYAARVGGIVKLFEKSKDIKLFQEGDYGVFLDSHGEKQIMTYLKLGKKFKKMDLNGFLPTITE